MTKILTIILLGASTLCYGQFNLNFYQMQGATPQNMNYNPAVFPKAKVFVSLPGISGIDLTMNNSFGISDVFTETGDSTLFDIDRFLLNTEKGAYFNATMGITDLMIGFRTGENGFVSLFVNEKVDATFFYPFKLASFIWEGNGNYVGQEYLVDDLSYDFTHYREIGIGYGRSFNIFGFNTNIGTRLKMITGILHSSVKDNLEMSVLTREEDYSVLVTMESGLTRTAGVDALEDENFSYFGFNENRGFGIDLGVEMDLTDRITVGLSAVDLGWITWEEYAETASFTGASFEIQGSTFDDINQLATALSDSIESLEIDTTATSFRTTLNSRLFLSGRYRVTDNGFAHATLSNYFTQGKMKSAFGVGYTQNLGNWLSASATFSAASQHGADMGLGLMLRGGFFQTYVSVDHLLNTANLPEARGVNIKFGINFLFGNPDKIRSK